MATQEIRRINVLRVQLSMCTRWKNLLIKEIEELIEEIGVLDE